MPRVFFAVHLTDEIKEKLTALQKQILLPRSAVKWVEPHNLHITLQFLGDVDGRTLAQVLSAARQASRSAAPFTLCIRGMGAFPSPKRPRVIWAGVEEGAKDLEYLANVLSMSLGMQPDKQFSPHITLGRLREGRRADLSALTAEQADYYGGSMTVAGFFCVSSTLTPKGPVYETLAEFLLEKKF